MSGALPAEATHRAGTKPAGLRIAGLFSGVGGLELGLHRAGHQTHFLCELDPAARAVLSARFGLAEGRLHEDVRRVEALPEGTDLVCGGFPCQDLSSVGRKAGIGGHKSGLVEELLRLLARRRTPWVLFENVAFMLRLDKGRAMSTLADRLEDLGYRWAYRVVDTAAFGLPQRRHRVFLLASLDEDPKNVLFADDAGPAPKRKPRMDAPIGFYWTEGRHASGLNFEATPPLKAGSTIGIPSPPAILFPDGRVSTPDIRDAERLQGFPADWTKPAEDVARASGRWRMVGNAVTVEVAEWIGGRLLDPGRYDAGKDAPLASGKGWPKAAWSDGNGAHQANVSDQPLAAGRGRLSTFLEYPGRPLSERATRGFLKRARAGTLRFPEGFLDALEAHADRRAVASS